MLVDGRYVLGEELGRGASATVYRARYPPTASDVALKLLRPEACLAADALRRAQREANVAAALCHPNIVEVHEHGSHEGQPFLVMEWVRGPTLAEALQGGQRLEADRALSVVAQVARGLEHAHRAGVVHRDVKPGNILLRLGPGARLGAKLADFGVASVPAADRTLGGAMIGTPAYMSPEQIRADPVDGRADLYALGVVMFRTLTGRLPFEGRHAIAMVLAHVSDPVPTFAEVAPDLEPLPDLERVTRQLLEKDPDRRYPSATALLEALSGLDAQSPRM